MTQPQKIRLASGRYLIKDPDRERPASANSKVFSNPLARLDSVAANHRNDEPIRHALVEQAGLTGMKVLQIGAGAVGWWTGLQLVAMGCSLTELDHDTVQKENLEAGRTFYPPDSIGTPKVLAHRKYLLQMYPHAHITPLRKNTADLSDGEIAALVESSDVVVGAFDEGRQLLRFDSLAYWLKPVAYAFFHRQARQASVIWTRPGNSPCLRCSLGVESEDDIETLHRESIMGIDVQPVANMCARVAMWLLSASTGPLQELFDPEKNIIFMENRPSETGLAVHFLQADRNPTCEVCNTSF